MKTEMRMEMKIEMGQTTQIERKRYMQFNNSYFVELKPVNARSLGEGEKRERRRYYQRQLIIRSVQKSPDV